MENTKCILIGILGAIFLGFLIYDGIDLEVARRDYVKNVEQCEPIDGCLFDWNCRKYNNMIEKACKK